jgi:hypothetical protein
MNCLRSRGRRKIFGRHVGKWARRRNARILLNKSAYRLEGDMRVAVEFNRPICSRAEARPRKPGFYDPAQYGGAL